jgi:hypothetical protein
VCSFRLFGYLWLKTNVSWLLRNRKNSVPFPFKHWNSSHFWRTTFLLKFVVIIDLIWFDLIEGMCLLCVPNLKCSCAQNSSTFIFRHVTCCDSFFFLHFLTLVFFSYKTKELTVNGWALFNKFILIRFDSIRFDLPSSCCCGWVGINSMSPSGSGTPFGNWSSGSCSGASTSWNDRLNKVDKGMWTL